MAREANLRAKAGELRACCAEISERAEELVKLFDGIYRVDINIHLAGDAITSYTTTIESDRSERFETDNEGVTV